MQPPAPTVHPLSSEDDAAELLSRLRSGPIASHGDGIHVLVRVSDAGSTGYARVEAGAYAGTTLERWIQHARRGSSPGGWTDQHHPRGEQQIGAWKDASAAALDRLLIDCCKQAWRIEQDAPYVVEFGVRALDACGVDAPPAAS